MTCGSPRRMVNRHLVELGGICPLLSRVVVELSVLTCPGDSRETGDIDDIPWLRETTSRFGCAKERKEGKRGEVVRSSIYAVSVRPEWSVSHCSVRASRKMW